MAKRTQKLPGLEEEALLWDQGNAFVFGVDEAGRGCLAGPVCAAVTAWSPEVISSPLVPVRDSKQMSEEQREALFQPIQEKALAFGVGFASPQEIDRWNILVATYLAAARALERALAQMMNRGQITLESIHVPHFSFLSDGNQPLISRAKFFVYSMDYSPEFPILQKFFHKTFSEKCVIKGDSNVYSIASASVLAKVSRDRFMVELDKNFPDYEFRVHKGYSTARHIENLNRVGPCAEHRMTFSPVLEASQRFQ